MSDELGERVIRVPVSWVKPLILPILTAILSALGATKVWDDTPAYSLSAEKSLRLTWEVEYLQSEVRDLKGIVGQLLESHLDHKGTE